MQNYRTRNARLLLCLFLLLCLSSCKGKGEPAEFTVNNEESFGSMGSLLGEGCAKFVSSETPSEKEIEAHAQEENPAPLISTFTYSDLAESGATVEQYMKALIDVQQRFMVIDESGARDIVPDFSADSGTLVLRRTNMDTFIDVCLKLEWTGSDLRMEAWQQEANSTFAVFKPKEEGAAEEAPTNLSASEAINCIKGLTPATLGLPGSSMQSYNVYYTDGKADVDGKVCVRLRVYETGAEAGTNNFLGTFLLATDRSALYRLDSRGGPPVALTLP